MKKTISRIAAFLLFGLALPLLSFGQTALTQTTISAAQGAGVGYSGITTPLQTQVTLASTTGVVAPFNGAITSYIYIDQELEAVESFNSTSGVVQVLRGQMGTPATPHASGTMALIGAVNVPGTNFFMSYNPSGACTTANTTGTPWINITTGNQFLCSTITGTWVPGFGNPGSSVTPVGPTASVASTAGLITPSGPLFHVTGTSAITGFNIPVGFNATAEGGGSFTVIPDAVFTYTAANNIGLASTGLNAGTAVVVVGQPITFVWDAKNSKFYPNTQ